MKHFLEVDNEFFLYPTVGFGTSRAYLLLKL
jgi:hypothetical protein